MLIKAEECAVEYAIITRAQANRPQLPMSSPSHVVFHEVGNMSPGADEDMHRDFVWNGGGPSQVSFHLVCGPDKIIQLLYINENAWHASDGYWGWGNRDSIAIEHIQIGDYEKTLRHSVWLMAELYRNPSRFKARPDYGFQDDLNPLLIAERTVTHNQTAPDKKWCPTILLNQGRLPGYIQSVNAELGKPMPISYKPPVLPGWWSPDALISGRDQMIGNVELKYCHMEYTATRETPVLGQVGGHKVRPNLKPGEKVDGRYRFKSQGGTNFVMTRWGSRIRADALSPFISMRGLV